MRRRQRKERNKKGSEERIFLFWLLHVFCCFVIHHTLCANVIRRCIGGLLAVGAAPARFKITQTLMKNILDSLGIRIVRRTDRRWLRGFQRIDQCGTIYVYSSLTTTVDEVNNRQYTTKTASLGLTPLSLSLVPLLQLLFLQLQSTRQQVLLLNSLLSFALQGLTVARVQHSGIPNEKRAIRKFLCSSPAPVNPRL